MFKRQVGQRAQAQTPRNQGADAELHLVRRGRQRQQPPLFGDRARIQAGRGLAEFTGTDMPRRCHSGQKPTL